MDSDAQPIQKGGLGPFIATVCLILPAAAACGFCYVFMHDPAKTHTAWWFWYEVFRPCGWAGVAMAALLFAIVAVRGKTSKGFLISMGITTYIGIQLQLLAAFIYRSPWG